MPSPRTPLQTDDLSFPSSAIEALFVLPVTNEQPNPNKQNQRLLVTNPAAILQLFHAFPSVSQKEQVSIVTQIM